jgi:hypothetical protein
MSKRTRRMKWNASKKSLKTKIIHKKIAKNQNKPKKATPIPFKKNIKVQKEKK